MKRKSTVARAMIVGGLLLGLAMGNVATARPSGPLGTFCAYLAWVSGGLNIEAGTQAQSGSPNAGNYVHVARYYSAVAYNYAVAGYYTMN